MAKAKNPIPEDFNTLRSRTPMPPLLRRPAQGAK
jgi:hypothetical protein